MVNEVNLQTALVNGAELHYIEHGVGEALIFVHGSLGDYRTWGPQFEPFSQAYHTLSYSRRYHFPNSWVGDGTDYSPSLHADDLIAFIEAKHLAPANVAGNSFGAYTTLVAAIRRPDLFRKLVIGEPPVLPWLKNAPGGQAYYDGFMENAWIPAQEAFQKGNLEQGVRLFIDNVSGGAGIFDRMPDSVRVKMMDNARSLMAETASPNYFTEITAQQLERITVPILFLKGERSPKMFHLVIDQLARFPKNARLETIPNASHSMPSNNPTAYNQVVSSFLQD